MISGAHTILFAEDAERAREFLRDVLGFEGVDAGDGWLIFALPPGELAVHPGSGWDRGPGQHALFFMCRDIEQTVRELEAKGVEFTSPIEDEGVDAGDGWLIFALPPGELAVHPGSGWGRGPGHHVLFFMCRDIEQTVRELEAKGVEFTSPIEDEGWGRIAQLRIPGAGEIGVYEPRHPSPLPEFR